MTLPACCVSLFWRTFSRLLIVSLLSFPVNAVGYGDYGDRNSGYTKNSGTVALEIELYYPLCFEIYFLTIVIKKRIEHKTYISGSRDFLKDGFRKRVRFVLLFARFLSKYATNQHTIFPKRERDSTPKPFQDLRSGYTMNTEPIFNKEKAKSVGINYFTKK